MELFLQVVTGLRGEGMILPYICVSIDYDSGHQKISFIENLGLKTLLKNFKLKKRNGFHKAAPVDYVK